MTVAIQFLNVTVERCRRNGSCPKIWQVLDEDEEIYDAADRFIEGGDWIVEWLCGKEARSSCMAGYKGMWDKEEGFPSPELLKALHPKLANLVEQNSPPTSARLERKRVDNAASRRNDRTRSRNRRGRGHYRRPTPPYRVRP